MNCNIGIALRSWLVWLRRSMKKTKWRTAFVKPHTHTTYIHANTHFQWLDHGLWLDICTNNNKIFEPETCRCLCIDVCRSHIEMRYSPINIFFLMLCFDCSTGRRGVVHAVRYIWKLSYWMTSFDLMYSWQNSTDVGNCHRNKWICACCIWSRWSRTRVHCKMIAFLGSSLGGYGRFSFSNATAKWFVVDIVGKKASRVLLWFSMHWIRLSCSIMINDHQLLVCCLHRI